MKANFIIHPISWQKICPPRPTRSQFREAYQQALELTDEQHDVLIQEGLRIKQALSERFCNHRSIAP